MSLAKGTRLGPYEIVAPLGAGGMGEVYKARDTRLDRMVAIKVLRSEFAADSHRQERFRREARAISALSHPHICALYDVGEEDGVAYLVIEHLSGETLEQRLRRGPLNPDDAVNVAVDIADALEAAHRGGIVHRDLKPANVMLTKDGAKLLDFGIAALTAVDAAATSVHTQVTASGSLTGPATVLGTLAYMSPEQLEGRDADVRSDIWALGAVTFELFNGTKLFSGEARDILRQVRQPSISWRETPAVPAGIDKVVAKCLSPDPDDRWQSAGDFRDAVRLIAAAGGTKDPSPGRRGGEAIAWTVATALALVLAATIVATRSTPHPPRQELGQVKLQIVAPATPDPAGFALSPDGRRLAFVGSDGTRVRLWVRDLDSTHARSLNGTDGASFPFWSPDGRSIGFFAGSKLRRIDVATEAVQILADAFQGRGGTWNAGGVILFARSAASPIYRVSAAGGDAVAITQLDPEVSSHRSPQFLPDGHHYLFMVHAVHDKQGVHVGDIEAPGSAPRRLFYSDSSPVFVPPDFVMFARQHVSFGVRLDAKSYQPIGAEVPINEPISESTLVGLAASGANGVLAYRDAFGSERSSLVLFDRSGRRLARLGVGELTLHDPELSPDGRSVAFEGTTDPRMRTDVWMLDTARGATRRFTYDSGAAPVWSPDGTWIVFSDYSRPNFDLFLRPVDGTTAAQPLLKNGQQNYATDWSADGRFILYNVIDPVSGYDVAAVPSDGSGSPVPLANSRFEERQGQFAPNGRWFAFQSDESGRFEIYLQPFPGPGPKLPVTTEGGTQPRWRGDGRELFYVAPDATLMAVPVTWSRDGSPDVGRPTVLFRTDMVGGGAPGLPGTSRFEYAVKKDASVFLVNTRDGASQTAPITIVLNWAAGAKE